jgi:hypothetical protein
MISQRAENGCAAIQFIPTRQATSFATFQAWQQGEGSEVRRSAA